jgi:hypothetical protein
MLAAASVAQAAWQYRGAVDDGFGTTFQLVVRHIDGKPHEVLFAASGMLHLKCEGGARRRARASANEGLLLYDHQFGISSESESLGPGGPGRDKFELVKGRVFRRQASGSVRVKTRVGARRCDSGSLTWHSYFVPRGS